MIGTFSIFKLKCGLPVIVSIEDSDLSGFHWHEKLAISGAPYARRIQVTNGKRRIIMLHNVVMERKLGTPIPDGFEVDHVNGDALDNRRDNLRLATHRQNMQNRRANPNKTGFRGVRWNSRSKRFEAFIRVDGKKIYVGGGSTPEEAHEKYKVAALKYFGEFARFD